MDKYERIERLLYFREWAIALAQRTQNPVYFDMMLDTFKRLRDLGVIVADVGIERIIPLLSQIEKLIGYATITSMKKSQDILLEKE